MKIIFNDTTTIKIVGGICTLTGIILFINVIIITIFKESVPYHVLSNGFLLIIIGIIVIGISKIISELEKLNETINNIKMINKK